MQLIPSKNELRLQMKSRLAALEPQEYQDLNRSMYSNFIKLKFLKEISNIMIYYSVRNEVDTVAIINYLLENGKTVALPVCTLERDLKAAVINDLGELQPAAFGLREPGSGAPLLDNDKLELIVIPGVVFDGIGNRLGHGAGYYDRFLFKIPRAFKMGLAYDFQLIPTLPAESHDIRMNGILTPSRYLEF